MTLVAMTGSQYSNLIPGKINNYLFEMEDKG